MEKKKWGRPLLTVMMRGTPEERVLDNCKAQSSGTTGSVTTVIGCSAGQWNENEIRWDCVTTECSPRSTS